MKNALIRIVTKGVVMKSAKVSRTSAAAAALCAGSVFLTAHAAGQENADALWSAMTRCAAMNDAASRHVCTDEALMSAGLLTRADLTAQRRQNFGLPAPKAEPAPKVAPAAEPAPAAIAESGKPEDPEILAAPAPALMPGAPEEEEGDESEDAIAVTLAEVAIGRSKRVVLITDEGAVWRQTDGGALRPTPKPGQAMTIERTSFGGYMCKIGKWTVFRCQRQA